jgi:hypothetical protein
VAYIKRTVPYNNLFTTVKQHNNNKNNKHSGSIQQESSNLVSIRNFFLSAYTCLLGCVAKLRVEFSLSTPKRHTIEAEA